MSRYSVEVGIVTSLVVKCGYSEGIAAVVGEMLSTELGRLEASAVSAKKDGRCVKFGKVHAKDKTADAKLSVKFAKQNAGLLPFRLLIIADGIAKLAKDTDVPEESIEIELPEMVRLNLDALKSKADKREAEFKERMAVEAKERAERKARQELAEQLLAEHEAKLAKDANKGKVAEVATK